MARKTFVVGALGYVAALVLLPFLLTGAVTVPYPPQAGDDILAASLTANLNALASGVNNLETAGAASLTTHAGTNSTHGTSGIASTAALTSHAGTNTAHGCTSIASTTALTAHTSRTDNPHGVTAAQVGALTTTGTAVDSDKVDGNHASAFLGASAKAADSDLLDGNHSTAFLGASAKAADSDLLDGNHSTAFLGASSKAADSDLLDGQHGTYYARRGSTHMTSDFPVGGTTVDSGAYIGPDTHHGDSDFDYIITHHTGIALSAHSAYEGVRIYNQGGTGAVQAKYSLRAQFSTNVDLYGPVNIDGHTAFHDGNLPYDLSGFVPGTLPDAPVVFLHKAVRAFAIPQNLSGSYGLLLTATTGAKDFDVQVDGVSKGTISFAAGATTSTFTFANTVSVSAGNVVKIVGPATADATLAGFSFTLKCTLNE